MNAVNIDIDVLSRLYHVVTLLENHWTVLSSVCLLTSIITKKINIDRGPISTVCALGFR